MLEPGPGGPGGTLPEAAYADWRIALAALLVPAAATVLVTWVGSRVKAPTPTPPAPEPTSTQPVSPSRPLTEESTDVAISVLQRMLDKVQEQLDDQEREHRRAVAELGRRHEAALAAQAKRHDAAMAALGKRHDRIVAENSEFRVANARLELKVETLSDQVTTLRGELEDRR